MTPVAWHGDPALKAEAVAAMTAHRAADEFVQGSYVDTDPGTAAGYRGCFHGCLTVDRLAAEAGVPVVQFIERRAGHTAWHREGERLWGIPEVVGHVLDWAFEEVLQPGAFAVAATEAIPVGADLSLVLSRWMLDILDDPNHGVWIFTEVRSCSRAAVEAVAALYRRRLAGDEPDAEDWRTVGRTAVDDAGYVAHYAGLAAPLSISAQGFASIAASYALSAARAVVSVEPCRRWMIDRLLAHLSEAPVPAVAA
jgi:hypothetical protein